MKKIFLLAFVLMPLLTAIVVSFIQPVKASGTIYIRADGSIEGTKDISTVDNVTYTFTDNIFNQSIVVERDNIVVDGASYTVQGTESGKGIDLTGRSNVTIKNMVVGTFGFGILVNYGSNNEIIENNITNNTTGISLSWSSNSTISGNTITANTYNGIHLYWGAKNNTISGNTVTNNREGIDIVASSNNTIYHNNFIDNTNQANSGGSTNTWDKGKEGNYWSDYTGVDADEDGIGNTPYVIDDNNQDSYPLMSPWNAETPEVPFWMQRWFWTIIAVLIVTLAGAVYLKKRKSPISTVSPLPTED